MSHRRVAGLLLALLVAAGLAAAHGSTEPPPPPADPIPRPKKREPPRQPEVPPPLPGTPPSPTTPPEFPQPGGRPGGFDDPTPAPAPVPIDPEGQRPSTDPRRGIRPPELEGRVSTISDTWRLWWEYNREHLVGIRRRVRERIVLTGEADALTLDALGERRAETTALLRRIAEEDRERDVRASALIALGRIGGDAELRLALRLFTAEGEADGLREAAAVACGLLSPTTDPELRDAARATARWVFDNPGLVPQRAEGMFVLATGMRARADATLRMELVGRAADELPGGEEAVHLALALGLAADPMVSPELIAAVRGGALGRRELGDHGRAIAATALSHVPDPAAGDTLVRTLESRRTGLATQRAATLGIGRVLREREPDEAFRVRAERVLTRTLEKGNDMALRGYAAVALGGARPPLAVPLLQNALDHGGAAPVKPYLAIALGLAAGSLEGTARRPVARFLRDELEKTNAAELESALCIALGLSGSEDAGAVLLKRLTTGRNSDAVRSAAAQGLGLLERPLPEAAAELEKLLGGERGGELLAEAALALGLMGHRGVVPVLCELMPKVRSTGGRGRLMLALGHMAHSGAVEPLLGLLADTKADSTAREFAAVALGLLGSRHEPDPLFDLDAWWNLHATTTATHELIRLY